MKAGVCRYCHVTDDQVDGDRLRWHDAERTCCSQYACVKQYERAAQITRDFRPRRRSPAEVHQQIVAEHRERRRRARARTKGRAA